MSTLKDIAKYTGLSATTVSKYVNGRNVKEKHKILLDEAIKKFDYTQNHFAKTLRTNKTALIGVLIDSFSSNFASRMCSRLDECFGELGYSTIFCEIKVNQYDTRKRIEYLISSKVNFIVIISGDIRQYMVDEIENAKIPMLVIDSLPKVDDMSKYNAQFIFSNNTEMAKKAMSYLIDKGHKKIAVITGLDKYYSANKRLNGALSMKIDGVEILPFRDTYDLDGGYRQAKLAIQNEVTAIFSCNDMICLGVIKACSEMDKRIPEDISLITFDDDEVFKIFPSKITAIRQNVDGFIDQVKKDAISILASNKPVENIQRIKAQFIERDSVRDLLDKL